jgi:hypothetical protein
MIIIATKLNFVVFVGDVEMIGGDGGGGPALMISIIAFVEYLVSYGVDNFIVFIVVVVVVVVASLSLSLSLPICHCLSLFHCKFVAVGGLSFVFLDFCCFLDFFVRCFHNKLYYISSKCPIPGIDGVKLVV